MTQETVECVVGIYDRFDKAKDAVQALEDAEYPAERVSLVTQPVDKAVDENEPLQYGDKTERNAATGAGMGGLIGALLGTPLVAIGGVGTLLLAGPIATGIAGAIVGGFLGAMSGWGVHEDNIQRYEQQVADGSLLVIANGDPLQVAEAQQILRQTEAIEVHRHAETSADAVEP